MNYTRELCQKLMNMNLEECHFDFNMKHLRKQRMEVLQELFGCRSHIRTFMSAKDFDDLPEKEPSFRSNHPYVFLDEFANLSPEQIRKEYTHDRT